MVVRHRGQLASPRACKQPPPSIVRRPIHLILVGHGQRLFEDTPTPLRLVRHEAFETGVLNLTYTPAIG
ncbi:MAG: hypothetical protein ACRDZ0_08040 [Acidimicrobiales bacterium]